MIQEMQDSILTRLGEQVTGIALEAYPDEPTGYRLKHRKGAALVRYMGASFRNQSLEWGADAALEFLSQPGAMTLTWQVNLMMRSLKGNQGVYQKLDEIRAGLVGFKPTGGLELIPIKEGFIAEEDGIWNYFIQFRTTT